MRKSSHDPNDSRASHDDDRPETPASKHGGVVIAAVCLGLLVLLVLFNMST